MESRSGLDVAVDLFRRPNLVRSHRQMALPGDVLTIIRVAAGAEIEIGKFGQEHERSVREVREAAVFYLQQVLFYPQADAYRLLGLRPGASAQQIQEHKRLLLKWLHPDRNHNKWEQALFQRVITAAANLEHAPTEGAAADGLALVGPVDTAAEQRNSGRSRDTGRTEISRSRSGSRGHGGSNRQLKVFLAQRQRKPVHWWARLKKYLRRAVLAGGVLGLGLVVWSQVTGLAFRDGMVKSGMAQVSWLNW